MLWLGAQLAATAGMERAAGVLAACLLVGALANAAAGMIQFYGLPEALQDFVAELHHDPLHNGAYGNIGQSNLYANYLALGGTALLFLWQRAGLRTAYALAAAVLLAWACAFPVRAARCCTRCGSPCSARSPGARSPASKRDA